MTMVTKELLRAVKEPDANGDVFTPECLERVVKKWRRTTPHIFVTRGFRKEFTELQGRVRGLRYDSTECAILADVEVLDTPQGNPIAKNPDAYELAAAGRVLKSKPHQLSIEATAKADIPARLVTSLEIVGASFVLCGEKVK
jgi:hypothetical protein